MFNLSKFSGIPTTIEIAEKALVDELKLCRKVGQKGFLVIKREPGVYPVYVYATKPKQRPEIIKVVKI